MGRDSSIGIATPYGLDGPRIESRSSQWPSGLKRGSAAHCFLGLRLRIPPGSWMFVLYSTDKKQKPGQSEQRSTDKVQSENKRKIPVEARIYSLVQTGCWAHPSSCTIGTGVPSRVTPGAAGAWR